MTAHQRELRGGQNPCIVFSRAVTNLCPMSCIKNAEGTLSPTAMHRAQEPREVKPLRSSNEIGDRKLTRMKSWQELEGGLTHVQSQATSLEAARRFVAACDGSSSAEPTSPRQAAGKEPSLIHSPPSEWQPSDLITITRLRAARLFSPGGIAIRRPFVSWLFHDDNFPLPPLAGCQLPVAWPLLAPRVWSPSAEEPLHGQMLCICHPT
jgi:hypothetical protein